MQGFVHINYLPKSNWIHPILGKLHSSSCEELRLKVAQWGESELAELGLALSTKFSMLPYISERINKHIKNLASQLNDASKVEQCIKDNSAYPIKNNDFSYELLVDLDSFIFETRSSYELMGKFIKEFFNFILGKKIEESDLHEVLSDSGMDLRWTEVLKEGRIHFFHNAAPWFAVEVSQIKPIFEYSIILLKKNLTQIHGNEEHYINFNELRDININFQRSIETLQKWILKKIDEIEKLNRK